MAARFAYTISRGWFDRVAVMPWRKVLFVVFGALGVSLLLITPASANVVSDAISGFIAGLFLQIASLFVGIMAFFVSLLINVASYNNFINGPGVIVGWTLVRDIANMFFVVILLLIAFGTILGLDQYHYKKLLPRFVGAALLINFSRLIVGLIIDAAQVIMMTFVNAISQVGGGNFIQAFQINNAWKVAQGSPAAGGFEQIITAMFVMVLIFIAAVLIGMFALLLVLRMVTLWVLIVLSPLAALLYTVPAGDFKKYYDEWWGKFKANVFLGPVVAFFLWLALTMSGDGTALYGQLKGGGNSGEANQALAKSGITGSAISTIENLSSFVIAAAIFAIAFDMAKKMSATAGIPGAGMITKAAGGLIKGGIGELTGYSAAGRALSPAWKQVKELSAKSALGTGMGKRLERATLATAAVVAPGAAGSEAKERLMTARFADTQKAQQNLKRQTNDSLAPLALKGGAEGRAAALELTSRGHRFKPEEAERVLKNMGGDERGFDQLRQNMKKNMPELAYNLNNEKEREAMLTDPGVDLKNLGPRTFTDEAGLPTPEGIATMQTMLQKRGPKGVTKMVEEVRDRDTRNGMMQIMQESMIPTAVAESETVKTRLQNVEGSIGNRQAILRNSQQRGLQTAPAVEGRRNLTNQIVTLQAEQKSLETRRDSGSAMVEAHVKDSGRPDEALANVADPVIRQREMAAVLKKVKLSDLKDDALKSPDVIAGMQGAFGGRVGDAVKLMNPDKQKVVMETLNTMDVATAPQEAVQVRIQLTGKLEGANPTTIEKAVEVMTGQQLGTLDTSAAGPDVAQAVLDGLAKNMASFRTAPTNKEANPLTLRRIKREVLASVDVQHQPLQDAVAVPGKNNKWNDVIV